MRAGEGVYQGGVGFEAFFCPDPQLHSVRGHDGSTGLVHPVDPASEGLAQLAQLLSREKLEVHPELRFQPTQAADESSTMLPPPVQRQRVGSSRRVERCWFVWEIEFVSPDQLATASPRVSGRWLTNDMDFAPYG
jgi:hypothetical protein